MTIAMTVSHDSLGRPRHGHAYLRPPAPLHFPVGEEVPESLCHHRLRSLLFEIVRLELGERGLVACDQFLYWDPTDPKQNLAPDLAVRVGAPPLLLRVWKTWELGAPQLAVEVVSEHDRGARELERELERYRRAGVAEVVRFDPEHDAQPIRTFDLFDGDLVERDPAAPDAFRCDALGLYWTLRHHPELGLSLRLARDAKGTLLLPTPEEAALAAKEAALNDKDAALARIAELEAALAKR